MQKWLRGIKLFSFYFCMTMIQTPCIIYMFLLVSVTGAAESNIVAGKVAKPHSRPYMASLQFNGKHSCGGTLIREDFVMTAAHCKNSQTMEVVLGAHNINKAEKTQQRIAVARYYQHPNFTGQFDYDIMLLKLKKPAKLSKYVKTIGLPNKNGKIPANINCAVAGWGQTGDEKPPSDVLRETTEKVQFNFECKKIWDIYFNSDHMMCTKFDRKKGGVCQGDSGGPLICNRKVQGITAYTKKGDCSDSKYPHVFTKVNYFSSWIKRVMNASVNVA